MNSEGMGIWGLVIALIGGAIKVSTPFLYVSLGECITEKSGRVNLGLEGVLVLGAMSGYGISYMTGSPWLGVFAAGIAGTMLAGFHGYVSRHKSVNSLALGIAIMTFGLGLSFFLGKSLVKLQAPLLSSLDLAFWSDNPAVKEALKINSLFIIGVLLAPGLKWAFANTRWGLIVRMCGESAQAARSQGYDVDRVRLFSTMAGGFLAGIGGSFLSLFYPGAWVEGLSSGQGLMAVALVIFAGWDPVKCLYTSLLFGAAGSIGVALQSIGISEGFHLFNAAPAFFAVLIMVFSSTKNPYFSGQPAELVLVQ